MATGTGLSQVARAALAAGAAELGVATSTRRWRYGPRVSRARAGLAASAAIEFGPVLLADVQIAVSLLRQLDALLAAVRRTGRTVSVTLKSTWA